ncbi:MAG: 2Fe-2S iron-sulfur cluster-binding protein [Burkholderiales bacterium]
MSGYRLPTSIGAWIDREKPLQFDFNGRSIDGLVGDTVASALLANGVRIVGRSHKLHRPRGIFSCGVEEPSALLDIDAGAWRTANTRATDIQAHDGLIASSGNCWPTLDWDAAELLERFSAVMPAGFYYKTFMWPHWHLFESGIRQMAAASRIGTGADPERYDEVSVSAEVLVVGGGMAGLQAAYSAARVGRQVLLLEAERETGGWLAMRSLTEDESSRQRVRQLRSAVTGAGVQQRLRCTAVALYDHHLVTAIETCEGASVRERLWKIRANQIVLATGAFERPMLFPDNDRPGVMLAGAVERYASLFGVACGKKTVIATASDSGYGVASSLIAAGVGIAAIVDRRESAGVQAPQGVPLYLGSSVVAIKGRRCVQGVKIMCNGGVALSTIEADLVASVGGFTPNVNLYSQAGGTLRWLDDMAMFIPDQPVPGVAVVGACAGAFDLDAALAHAEAVGKMVPGSLMPMAPVGGVGIVPADNQPTRQALGALGHQPGKQFVDLQNDVCASDVALAARENYRSVEHLKRYTTLGMATDQGKTSNVNALVLMAKATGSRPELVGTTRFRPPYKPVTLNAIVGGRSGARYRPLKQMPGHAWHAAHGAVFEEFGGWERPVAYPKFSEDLIAAAEREAAEVRSGVGLFEGSSLGKIEIYGPDAATFLDHMYVGTLSSLSVGSARYGAMCNENGIIVDDGIVARLGSNHFLVNTTSSGVERTVLAFDEWLQCEFLEWRVLVVPVTSQWGNVTVSGPNAWKLLQEVGFDNSLAPASMKHMTVREICWQGYPLRVMRASFTGELGYEINLPSSQVPSLMELLWNAGTELRACAYGVEALMIMRTEKGFLHVGADTDGTTLPGDVGLARALAKKGANFVGRRSLTRTAALDPERLQLVGLQPVDRRTRLSVGAHLSVQPPPTDAAGFITSSCFSPALQQPIALALVKRGTQRLGELLTAWHLGTATEVEVVALPFFDPAGERLNG